MDGEAVVQEILEHHGVKGQKWGVTRNRGGSSGFGPQNVVIRETKRGIKTSGGAGHPAVPEALSVRRTGQIARKSGVKALTDKELNDYARRIELEQRVKRLQFSEASPPRKFILTVLGRTGKTAIQNTANDVATQQTRRLLIKLGAAAA